MFLTKQFFPGRADLAAREREREERVRRLRESQDDDRRRKLEELKQHVSCHQIVDDVGNEFIMSRLYKHRSSESSKKLSEDDILSRCGLKMRTGAWRWRRGGGR